MIVCILGKTNSGKTTLFKHLNTCGFETLISHTTRPIRENEKSGKDYYFIDDETYDEMEKLDLLTVQYTVINAHGDRWRYALAKAVLEDLDKEGCIFVVIDPSGFRRLKREFKNVIGFYLDTSYEERKRRGTNRDTDLEELERRLKSDEVDFCSIGADRSIYRVKNSGTLEAARFILKTLGEIDKCD